MAKKVKIHYSSEYDLLKVEDIISTIEQSLLLFLDTNFEQIDNSKNINLSLTLLSDAEIKDINLEHRSKNKATDVLSFPLHESIRNDDYDKFYAEIELGDIVISKDICKRQAQEHGIDFYDEFIHLVFHGFLHLLGYDHEIDSKEDKLMRSLEIELVEIASKIKKDS